MNNLMFQINFVCVVILLAISVLFSDKRWSWITGALAIVGLIVMILSFGLNRAKAQENVTSLFTFSCYVTEEGRADVLVTSDGNEHYTLDNPTGADTNIPADFTTEVGTYVLGYVDTTYEYPLYLVRDDGAGGDLSMTADWQAWCDKDNTPLEEPVPTEEPKPIETPVYVPPAIVSTGRTCVVQYLQNQQVTIACSG